MQLQSLIHLFHAHVLTGILAPLDRNCVFNGNSTLLRYYTYTKMHKS